jgi:hypothetical protein
VCSSDLDSDGDGIPDYIENQQGTNPNDPRDSKDSDGDGVPDYIEDQQGTDKNQAGDEISSFGTAFENSQMASARVRTKDGSVLLSQGVNVLEESDNVKSMADGGAQFVAESKKLFNQFLDKNINHLSGHNIFFDLQKMAETLQGLDAYDDKAKELMTSVFDRIANDKNFLIDTK